MILKLVQNWIVPTMVIYLCTCRRLNKAWAIFNYLLTSIISMVIIDPNEADLFVENQTIYVTSVAQPPYIAITEWWLRVGVIPDRLVVESGTVYWIIKYSGSPLKSMDFNFSCWLDFLHFKIPRDVFLV